ncbi:glycosyltransferase [Solibacillus sp. CAU 1738]|uniref:CgeB family protein n=1 Tax=Solibacillus sp. CAU 1738 TaxID=3140363 RepID=UPI003261044B
MNKIIIELAKNQQYTCKYLENDKYKYLYSKYIPEKINFEVNINEDTEIILLLGLGLGYELNLIRQKTNKIIYVLENNIEFIKHNKNLPENVILVYGDEYKQLVFNKKIQIVINDNLMNISKNYFKEVLDYIKFKKNMLKILVVEHPTVMLDCVKSFEKMGFEVDTINLKNLSELIERLNSNHYDYIFTINFYNSIANICEKANIKYLSWVVDTPCYSLYINDLNFNYSYIFIYDKSIVKDLKQKGATNVYYLPVAVDVDRLDNILKKDVKYSSDVSFLGSCCSHNEYLNHYYPALSNEIKELVEKIIEIQMLSNNYIIKDLVDKNFLDVFTKEGRIKLTNIQFKHLSNEDLLAFYLGRYHSYVERKTIINNLSSKFDVSLYGEEGWLREDQNGIIKKIYRGEADHYSEMPEIFRNSKINLNITRSFVESGLPMRVFDVLGSKGFLVTNDKEDIHRLFKPGRDLVIYRDLKDLDEIINYYLNHETERLEIAQSGYETTKNEHSFEHRINKMFDTIKKLD